MDWLLTVLGGILIAVVSGWLTWRWTNLRRLRVSVAAKGVVANIPLEPIEQHILEVTITNTGNKLVNIKQCYFTIDGEGKQVAVDRTRLVTMQEGLPRKLDAAEQCVICYPAVAFQGRRLTGVAVEDHLGKRWYASTHNVRRAEADLRALETETR